MERKNAVGFLGAWLDACALWRMSFPHYNYPGSQFFVFGNKPDFNLVSMNDVVVLQRCSTQDQYNFIEIVREMGIRVVYDLDDDFWNIPSFNPAAGILAKFKDGFIHCMKVTDVITVSTPTLAKVVKKKIGADARNTKTGKLIPIVVVENRIDTRLFALPQKKEKVIVGWAGSSSHSGDLEVAKPGLMQVASEYPDIEFQFRGMPAPSPLDSMPNVTFKLWTPVAEFVARMPMWGWSVALAPLTTDAFNHSKSCIKMLEAAYCRVPCLASWVEPYAGFCRHDKELQWLLCVHPDQWAPKLRELLNDPGRRAYLGNKMYDVMLKHYAFNRPHEGWDKALSLVRSV